MACGGGGYAIVTDRSIGAGTQNETLGTSSNTSQRPENSTRSVEATPQLPLSATYTVKRGDTLYSIAWRYGLDYKEVAKWNAINERFEIKVGQILTLTSPLDAQGQKDVAVHSDSSTPPNIEQELAVEVPETVAGSALAESAPNSIDDKEIQISGPLVWQWPSDGAIIGRFSSSEGGSRGVDLAGKLGDPVFAAASGRVVYAGSGLLGYGNLVIINHDKEYLSAYAHNSKMLVSENQVIKAGAKIAEKGQTGTNRVLLHFEIRKNGKPVNPLIYLPKR